MEDKNRNKEQGQQIENSKDVVDINSTMSIITLKVSGIKDRDYQSGLKKTQLYVSTRNPL